MFSSILIAVVLAVALMPLASAQADTTSSASTSSTDAPSDATPKGGDAATPDDATPKDDDTATSGDETPADDATATGTDAVPADDTPATPPTDAPAPPVADAPPADDDGVDAAIENRAPHAGDNNEDGIADAVQADVASLPAAVDVDKNGALDDYVTIVSPEGTTLHGVSALDVPTDSAPPEDAVFHYGLFDYEVQVANPGDNADVTIILPSGPAAASVYMFQDGTWTEVTQHADIDDDKNEVTVGLQDGGVGDADHAADGVIDDPVGIAGQPNTITVTKATSPAGLSGSFTMTLGKCSSGSTGSTCSSPANETPTFSLSHGQSGTWGAIELNRNYRLTETVPSTWNNPTISCTGGVTTSNGNANQIIIRLTNAVTNTTCTVTNTPQTGSITVTKAVPGTDPTDFPFTATGPNAPAPFSLDDDGNNTSNPPSQLPSSRTFSNLLRDQTYTFTELLPAGWVSDGNVSCTNTSSEQQVPNGVSVALDTSSTINCTFNNVKNIASITIVMDVSGGTDVQDFHFTTTGGLSPAAFDLDDDGNNGNTLSNTRTYTDIPASTTYTITEDAIAGWALTGVSCPSFSENQIAGGVSLALDPGDNVTCTFTNMKFSGTITVHKGGNRANPAGTDTAVNYAAGLQNAVFEYRLSGSADPWVTLCTTNANGDCTSGVVPPATYDVREKSAPAGWSTLANLTYGGDSSGVGNQSHAYLGTVTVGASGTSEPRVQYTNNAGDTENHRFINVKDDKPLPENQCGIDIAMVLDVSGSIGRAPSSPSIYQDAANQFITALDGTPTTLTRIVKFSDGATVVNPGNFPINLQTDAADAHTEIDGVYSSVGGGTNWDATLKAMAGSGADVVVMVTDGNPTTWDGSPNGGGGDITLNDLAAGIASANSLKVESTIIAVGVGNPPAVTATNLAAISGPGRFFTSNLTTIKNELAALANQLCGSRIHVQKWVGGQLTNGWTFAGAATGANVSYPKGQVTGGGSNPPLPTGEMQINLDNVPVNGATAVSVTETVLPNYGVVGRKCQKVGYPTIADAQAAGNTSSFNIGAVQRNEDWYCTFVNQLNPGSILVQKSTVGGLGTFNFTLTGQAGRSVTTTQQSTFTSPASGAWSGLAPGNYAIDETDPDASWTEGPFSCKNGQTVVASGAGPLQVSLAAGQNIICQITNTKKGSILVQKSTVGGLGTFNFTLTGQQDKSVTTTQQNTFTPPASGAWSNLVPGNYMIGEANPDASWVKGSFTCTLDGTQTTVTGASPQITLAAGQSWTCNITNTKKGSILVQKRTVGALGSFDFTLTGESGKSVTTTQQNVFTSPASGAWSNLTAGNYTIDETDPGASWAEGSFTCTLDGTQTQVIGASPQIALAAGQSWTCQITNTKKGSVVVQKRTLGGVGTFDFTLAGQSGKSVTTTQQNLFTSPVSGAWTNLAPGNFTIDETDPGASWVEGPFACTVGGNPLASGAGPLQFTLDPGADVVCQVTNTKNGTITVEKKTVGGVGSFDFTLTGQPNRMVQTVTPGVFLAGTPWSNLAPANYTIDEVNPGASWVEGSFTCTLDGTQTTVTGTSPQIPLAAGQSWTCQITNTKKGSVVVQKRTLSALGTFDFTLAGQSGKSVTTTQQNQFTSPASGAWTNLTPGSFMIDETNPDSSWIEGAFSCTVGGNPLASGAGPLQFTLDPGADVVCQITNTKKGSILVEKQTVGGVGSFDFTLTTQPGKSVTTTQQDTFTPPASGAWSNLVPGNYTIDETDPDASWIAGNFTCTLDGTQNQVSGASPQIQLAAGQSWTCRITNTKKGSVLVEKSTVGALGSFDFTLTGQSGKSVTTTQQNVFTQPASGAWTNLVPGQFTIDETNPDASWIEGPFSCKAGATTIASGNGPLQFTLDPGENVVCQITNTKNGSITIVKDAVPQAARDFTFNTTNLGGPFTLDDDGDGTLSNTKQFENLAPGTTYTVTEVPAVGWKLVTLECTGLGQGDTSSSSTGTVSVDVKPGQVASCTYTNQSPDLGVVKSDDPDPVVAGTQLTYTVVATNHGPADATGVVVTDTLDSNTTFVSTSLGADCTHAAGVVTCELRDMDSGDFVEFTITVLVSPGAPVGEDTLNNVVDVEGDQPDRNPENNHDEEPTSVISELDLAITKTDGGARPVAGQGSFTYTLSVDNLGPSDAQEDATVIDLLPAEVTFLSFGTLADGVTCDPPVGRTITCTLDKDLLDVADDPVEIPIEVTVKAGTPSRDITNETIVTSPDDEAPCVVTEDDITCDPSDSNNYDDVVTPVTAVSGVNLADAAPAPAAAALAFTGTASQTIALIGGLLLAVGAIFLLTSRRRRKKAALGS